MAKHEAVGVIGLGIMGSAVAANLLRSGFRVIGCDPLEAARERLVAAGGEAVAEPHAIDADLLISLLPGADALHSVVDQLLQAPRPGQLLIECSTLALADKLAAHVRLQAAGLGMLDSPLSGTGAQAARRDLLVLASGDREAYEACGQVLDGFARARRYVGPFGNGSRLKFIANLLVQIHNAAAAEAFALGRKAGLDPQLLYEILSDSAGSSRMLEVRGPMMVRRAYEPATMKLDLWRKDMDLIGAFAAELDCPTPLFSVSQQLYLAALAQGRTDSDTAVVTEVLAQLADLAAPNQESS